MDEISINGRIAEQFKQKVVSCIRSSIEDDLERYILEFGLDTRNGIGMQIGNFINTRLASEFTHGKTELVPFKRYGWHGRILVDRENRMVYTIMSNSRLKTLHKVNKETPHYARALAYFINKSRVAQVKQCSFLEYPYSDQVMLNNANDVLRGQINENEDYLYCIITYTCFNRQLTSCSISFVDKDLDIIEDISLNDYIRPEYAKLTSIVTDSIVAESKSSDGLLKKKTKNSTSSTKEYSNIVEQKAEQNTIEPILVREYSKQA